MGSRGAEASDLTTGSFLFLGWVWPFVAASAGVLIVSAGHRMSDGEVTLLFLTGLLGAPAVARVVWGWQPAGRSVVRRAADALLQTALIVGAEVIVAVYAFIIGADLTGYGWIE
jgi:hypothetical protein